MLWPGNSNVSVYLSTFVPKTLAATPALFWWKAELNLHFPNNTPLTDYQILINFQLGLISVASLLGWTEKPPNDCFHFFSQTPRHIVQPQRRADGKKGHRTIKASGLQHVSYGSRSCLQYSSPHRHMHIYTMRQVPAETGPPFGIRHASLSATAVLSLISRLNFVGALTHPCTFTQQQYNQWSAISLRQLLMNMLFFFFFQVTMFTHIKLTLCTPAPLRFAQTLHFTLHVIALETNALSQLHI